jgi:hypothetical protein
MTAEPSLPDWLRLVPGAGPSQRVIPRDDGIAGLLAEATTADRRFDVVMIGHRPIMKVGEWRYAGHGYLREAGPDA